MKKFRNNTNTAENAGNSELEVPLKSPDSITTEVERAVNQSAASSPSSSSIKLTSKGAIQLTSSSNPKATTNAILNLKNNPFFHDKRKWDESFTVDEKKELTGNIVKAAKDNDGETYVTLQEEEYTVPNLSHEEEDDSQESDDIDANGKKPGRKPMADEDTLSDSDQDPKVKRKAQNRAAQRAFRERKERYVKELESKIKQVQDAHLVATAQLVRENQQLRTIIYRLESENYALKGIPMQSYQTPPPTILPQQSALNQRSSSNYTNIAPLLPQTTSPQPSLLLPAYLSNSHTSMSPQVSSILQCNSPSVNQIMMLASSPSQQYPMSPVISSAIQNTQPSPSLTSKPISKKVSYKQTKSISPPKTQPLEYTFSISTPASLRPNGGSTSSSKHNRSEPIELVQLYPPGGNHSLQPNVTSPSSTKTMDSSTLQKSDLIMLSHRASNLGAKKALSVTSAHSNGSSSASTSTSTTTGGTQDDNCSVVSDKTISTVNTQIQQYKNIRQLEIDMLECHIDTECELFCEKLHNEVCNDAFNRLLSEPLFDQMGKLNLSISNYPVPIVTGPMSSMDTLKKEDTSSSTQQQEQKITDNRKNSDKSKEDNHDNDNDDAIIGSSKSNKNNNKQNGPETSDDSKKPSDEKKLLTCTEIWFILNQHHNFHKFTTDELFQAVKELAKCADSGPVFEEPDLYQILTNMDQGHL